MRNEKKIIKILTKSEKPMSKSEIARKLGVSTATASKYIDVLVAKKKLKLTNYGNIHIIELGDE
jgi:response regulator of citrate/malate metabolism